MIEQGGSVRFAVEAGFFMCGNDLFDLDMPMCEKLVYIALCRYAGSNNRAWPSYTTLCKDVSCGRTRLSEAINLLCGSGLIKREARGNRTNVYIIYPASSFKPCKAPPPEPQDLDNHGSPCELEEDLVVRHTNYDSSPHEPSQFATRTMIGRQANTKRNKKRNNEKNSSSSGGEGSEEGSEEREKNRQTEKIKTETIKTEKPKPPPADDIEQVRKAFRSKKVVVKDSIIVDLLKKHDTADVCGAIRATDFDMARNPINVIRWMLRENSYCMPLLPEAYSELHNNAPRQDYQVCEEERHVIKQMLREAKNGLLNPSPAAL